jgi:hypothetical protein
MRAVDLQLEPNEASDLCPVLDDEMLRKLGWDMAFATVLDESPAERALAVLGHAAAQPLHGGWSATRIKAKPDRAKGKTEDAEACSRRDGWLVLLGSQFGSKEGPLDPRRSWIARVREETVAEALIDGGKPRLELRRLRFGLHRAVNDALADSGLETLELGPRSRAGFIDETIALGAVKDKRWAGAVRSADQPINIEAAEFRGDGRLLLGLRYPVTAEGNPILLELNDVDALFLDGGAPRCSPPWVLEGAGDAEAPRGIRALHGRGNDEFDAIVGNLESSGKGVAVLEDHPEAERAASTHMRFSLPLAASGGTLKTEPVRDFGGETKRIEGIVTSGGHTYYVLDQDGRVALRALEVT